MNIVITGGSKGMGKALAMKFATAGNNIFIVHEMNRNYKMLLMKLTIIMILFNILLLI